MIRSATADDAAAIVAIYNHYILNSHATFELEEIDANEMISRIKKVQEEFKLPWLVLEEDGQIVGYAYATQWKARKAYSRTTESSIYLHKDQGGKGYGLPLYSELMAQLKTLGYHAIIGGMSLPNDASLALHEKLGFKKIGVFKEVGYKFDRWIDVGYWELQL
ncbi:arsinothricin resistance N-acetyltransferase ArsN1 family B [Ekhidna sp.]|uniref:arsinothricin resistance N-acetyltransferase ArsN1 family B n=1 Tax=Ekhidna sp. TaxID=2608089 RepID=UPI0035166175